MILKERVHYIDNIKIAITLMVVAHHAGQAYGSTGGVWFISDSPKLAFMSDFFFLNASYMMGFFFFVSGYFMYFSVAKKPLRIFLKDRFRRLGIPLLFFTFFIFIPLDYFISGAKSNYFSFMLDCYFHKPPLAVGHLWFVASLFVYTFIYLLIRKLILDKVSITFKPYYPLLYLFGLSTINYFLWIHYPIDHWETWLVPIEVAHLPQYLSLFLLGIIANKNRWLEQISLPVGISYMLIGFCLFTFRHGLSKTFDNQYLESFVESSVCVGVILGCLVLFKHYLNYTNTFLILLSNCSFGIYLFHLLLVIGFQILFKDIAFPVLLKFILVTLLSIVSATGLTYMLKKNNVLNSIL